MYKFDSGGGGGERSQAFGGTFALTLYPGSFLSEEESRGSRLLLHTERRPRILYAVKWNFPSLA